MLFLDYLLQVHSWDLCSMLYGNVRWPYHCCLCDKEKFQDYYVLPHNQVLSLRPLDNVLLPYLYYHDCYIQGQDCSELPHN